MEKVKTDTEIRKLDQLRAAHLNQQHSIRLQIRALPSEIKERQERIARLSSDIEARDSHAGEEFSMTAGKRTYSGRGAREDGATALIMAILSWRNDLSLQVRRTFRGFEILSRGRGQQRNDPKYARGCGQSFLPRRTCKTCRMDLVEIVSSWPSNSYQVSYRSIHKPVDFDHTDSYICTVR